MGNNIGGLNPTASVSVEQVLVDFEDWHHEKILGNSRFFKVSKISKGKDKSQSVLKVFKYPESSKSLVEKYVVTIQSYLSSISLLSNVLQYAGCFIKKDTAFLLRNFVHYSLNERICTRPFLTLEEKKWIAFQILCGLTQCHKERLEKHCPDSPHFSRVETKLCHGDLKTENIMVTDWGWVYLTDIAPFKPVYLPANNPSEFYFYFDVSGKRACYLAPERFIDPVSLQFGSNDISGARSTGGRKESLSKENDSPEGILTSEPIIDLSDQTKHVLKPSMDMFSTGCIFIELFTDGVIPFNLADLFNYRENDTSKLTSLLHKIPDKDIQNMIKQLLHLSPEKRISAEECLVSQRGKVFPDVFYRELKSYMVQFLNETFANPSTRINRLYNDLPDIMKTYRFYPKGRHVKNGILILFVNLITSVIFGVKEEYIKIKCLVMLKEFALYIVDELVLDRIVPFMLEFIESDHSIEVRRTALDCVVLSVMNSNPSSTADISYFPDYLLPIISELQKDRSVTIRFEFTRHIPCLAKTAHRFLKNCDKLQKTDKKFKEKTTINYQTELTHLREMFREMIVNLFSEQDVEIKCCVTQPLFLNDLAEFFDVFKATEILLSHMITFLNEKTNYVVRVSFYRCLPELIRIIGTQSSELLKTLFFQGLQDSHFQVVEACCESLSNIIRMNLMPDWLKSDLLNSVVPLLSLPYNCLRLSALDYIISFCTYSTLSTIYSSFLKCDKDDCIFKFKDPIYFQKQTELIIWSNLLPPLSRTVFEDIIKNPMADELLMFLNNLQKAKLGANISYKSGNNIVDNLYKKLRELGMTEKNELQILLLSKLITEIVIAKKQIQHSVGTTNKLGQHVYRKNSDVQYFSSRSGIMDPFPEAVSCFEFDSIQESAEVKPIGIEYEKPISKSQKNPNLDNTWPYLFGSQPYDNGENNRPLQVKIAVGDDTSLSSGSIKEEDIDWFNKKNENNKFRLSTFKSLTSGSTFLINEKASSIKTDTLPTAWKPKGILVGHLHEHIRGFTSIISHPTDKQLISCGADKTLKFWNCDPNPNKPDPTCSKYIPNKSSHSVLLATEDNTRNQHKGLCQSLTWLENFNSVAVVTNRKLIHIVDKIGEVKKTFEFPIDEYGVINNLTTPSESNSDFDSASQKTLIYSTTGNWITAHDIRCPHPTRSIWTQKQDNDYGFITCLAAYNSYTWLVTGTSRGSLICWDLRFQKVINKIDHPDTSGILSIKINPNFKDGDRKSQIWAAAEEGNEISSWDIESGSRIITLRTRTPEIKCTSKNSLNSKKTHLSNSQVNVHFNSKPFILRFLGSVEKRPCVLSGSSDCHLRFWDIHDPQNSSIVSFGGLDQYSSNITTNYQIVPNENNTVIIEEQQSVSLKEENFHEKQSFQPFIGHMSTICDLTTVSLGQPFLVSTSMDGVIKIWK